MARMLSTRQTDEAAVASRSRRLSLLVVSGVSRVGQSIFVEQLRSNSLHDASVDSDLRSREVISAGKIGTARSCLWRIYHLVVV